MPGPGPKPKRIGGAGEDFVTSRATLTLGSPGQAALILRSLGREEPPTTGPLEGESRAEGDAGGGIHTGPSGHGGPLDGEGWADIGGAWPDASTCSVNGWICDCEHCTQHAIPGSSQSRAASDSCDVPAAHNEMNFATSGFANQRFAFDITDWLPPWRFGLPNFPRLPPTPPGEPPIAPPPLREEVPDIYEPLPEPLPEPEPLESWPTVEDPVPVEPSTPKKPGCGSCHDITEIASASISNATIRCVVMISISSCDNTTDATCLCPIYPRDTSGPKNIDSGLLTLDLLSGVDTEVTRLWDKFKEWQDDHPEEDPNVPATPLNNYLIAICQAKFTKPPRVEKCFR